MESLLCGVQQVNCVGTSSDILCAFSYSSKTKRLSHVKADIKVHMIYVCLETSNTTVFGSANEASMSKKSIRSKMA